MQNQIENKIINMHSKIAISLNFQWDLYSDKELRAYCNKISKLHETLTFLALINNSTISSGIIPRINQVKNFAC